MSGWETGADPAFKLTMKVRRDVAWRTAWEAGTQYGLIVTFGRTAGRTFGVFARKLQIMEKPTPSDDGGMACEDVRFGLVSGHGTPGVIYFQG